jgi:Flp pilus assembly protein TadG
MKKLLKLSRNTEGQALVEAALVIFFVLTPLILGMIEFGWILNGKITLTSAAREGVRAAVIYETKEQAETAAKSAASKSASNSSLTNVNATVTTFDATDKRVVVSVTAKIKPIIGLYVGPEDIDLKPVTAEMRME